jgi:hypothetical protein
MLGFVCPHFYRFDLTGPCAQPIVGVLESVMYYNSP